MSFHPIFVLLHAISEKKKKKMCSILSEVIVITTKEVHKMMSTDPKMKSDLKLKLDVVSDQEDGDMGTADALRHIQRKIKVRACVCVLAIMTTSL